MTKPRFSANTGFLYPDLPFLDRISAAAKDGFDALEFHDEAQSADLTALQERLADAQLPVLGLNVAMGQSVGCAAIPGEESRARKEIDAAVSMADTLNAGAIHVLSGKTKREEARECYVSNLRYALSATSRTILIEPICSLKMPEYYLNSLDQALDVLAEVDHPRLKILFDCFHIETEHGNTLERASQCMDKIGHIQIASVPERSEPEVTPNAALDYSHLLPALARAGYTGAFGCEYVPTLSGDAAFAWRDNTNWSSV